MAKGEIYAIAKIVVEIANIEHAFQFRGFFIVNTSSLENSCLLLQNVTYARQTFVEAALAVTIYYLSLSIEC